MNPAPTTTPKPKTRWPLVGAVACVGVALGAYQIIRLAGPNAKEKLVAVKQARDERKEKKAVDYPYPKPSPSLPAAIKIEFDEGKNRTRMTAELTGFALAAPLTYRLSSPALKITSEFAGKARDPEHGELSVRATFSAISSAQGALAPSSPPALITADGKALHAFAPQAGESGYHSKSKPDGIHESLAFLIHTKDLITIAGAQNVTIKLGVATLTLTRDQIALIREFAARMDPTP